MEDYVFKDRKKKEEEKPFYIIHQGFMYKLYKYHLALNPPLLVNLLATITPDISMKPNHKKAMKTPSLEVNISIIESNIDTRRRNQTT